jgi:hypothetical protein
MPTAFYTFTPQQQDPPFRFQPMLENSSYVASVRWNTFGQRWYISLETSAGLPVFTQAMIGSPQLVEVQTVVWENGFAKLTAVFPTSFHVGDSFHLTVSGFEPDGYNTPRVLALVTKPDEIMWPVPTPLEPVTKLGRATYDVNLAGGYFNQASLVFRVATQQFETWSPP